MSHNGKRMPGKSNQFFQPTLEPLFQLPPTTSPIAIKIKNPETGEEVSFAKPRSPPKRAILKNPDGTIIDIQQAARSSVASRDSTSSYKLPSPIDVRPTFQVPPVVKPTFQTPSVVESRPPSSKIVFGSHAAQVPVAPSTPAKIGNDFIVPPTVPLTPRTPVIVRITAPPEANGVKPISTQESAARPEPVEIVSKTTTPKKEARPKSPVKTIPEPEVVQEKSIVQEQTGRPYKYSKEFLLTFRERCTVAPEGFVPITDMMAEVGKERKYSGPSRQGSQKSVGVKMTSEQRMNEHFSKIHSGKPHASNGRSSGKGSRKDSRKTRSAIPSASTSPLIPFVPIVVSENAWQPKFVKKDSNVDEASKKIDELTRKIMGLLNKLTPEHFDSLSNQVLNLDFNLPETLEIVIEKIFDKALTEPHFGQIYARLCGKLNKELPERYESMKTLENVQHSEFRRALLKKCQDEFYKGSKWADEDAECREKLRDPNVSNEEKAKLLEEQEARYMTKLRSLGNIKFIGELFKHNMISERIMHNCIIKMVNDVANPEEEQTESLCKFLTTVGSRLDSQQAKDHMDKYFERIRILSQNMQLSSRIRFMLMDLIDLRNNNWVSRAQPAGPKTLNQIRKDAVEKKDKKPKAVQPASQPKPSGRDEWQSVKGGAKEKGSRDKYSSKSKEQKTAPVVAAEPEEKKLMNRYDVLDDSEKKDSAAEEVPAVIEMDKDTATRKIIATIEEWFAQEDFKELELSLKELPVEWHMLFVTKILETSIDSNDAQKCLRASELLNKLHETTILGTDDIHESVGEYIEFIDDIAIDLPTVYKLMGIFLGKLAVSNILPIKTLIPMMKKINISRGLLVEQPALKLAAESLICIHFHEGDDALLELAQNIDWLSLFPKDKKDPASLSQWLSHYNLDILQPFGPTVVSMISQMAGSSAEELAAFVKTDVKDQDRNTSPFVKLLTRRVLEYLIDHTVDGDVEERQAYQEQASIMTSLISPLIKSLVELNQELQQVILETSQDFWFDTEQPLIFLDHLFRFYYNTELIEEEVFLKWKQNVEARVNCKKPKEKDVKALETVEGWFNWLKNSDETE